MVTMSYSPNNPYYMRMHFNAFDHFADTVRGWDLDFHQLDRGSFFAELQPESAQGPDVFA